MQPAFITRNSSAFPRTFLPCSTQALIVSGRAASRVWKFAALRRGILQREPLSGICFCWSLLLVLPSVIVPPMCAPPPRVTSREIYLLKEKNLSNLLLDPNVLITSICTQFVLKILAPNVPGLWEGSYSAAGKLFRNLFAMQHPLGQGWAADGTARQSQHALGIHCRVSLSPSPELLSVAVTGAQYFT